MEPGPINSKPKLTKEYELDFNQSKILLKIILSSSLIKFSVHFINDTNPYNYENSFSKENLSKINKYFSMFDSIDEIMNIFINLIENKKYSFNKIDENELRLNLKFIIFIKEEEISLNLYKNDNLNKDDIINNLIKITQDLTKRVQELEKWKKEKEKEEKKSTTTTKEDGNNLNKNIINISSILQKEDELKLIEQRLKSGVFSDKKISFKLLYCGTKDGDKALTFHQKCDNVPNQLVLVKTTEGLKFGGYTRLGFNSNNTGVVDKDAFLFSFDTKKIYNAIEGKETIYCSSSHGPTFGCYDEIEIPNNFLSSKGVVEVKMNRFKTSQDYEINGGNQYFKFKEVEVFQTIFE